MRRAAIALVLLSAAKDLAFAQSLSDRIADIHDGAVNFHYIARPGVCGDGEHFIRTGRNSWQGEYRDGWERLPCQVGPVQVRVTFDNGTVDRLQYWVGTLRQRDGRDLGAVAAPEAAEWLMRVAATANGRVSAKAIMPAVLADSAVVWPQLLAIAKDTETRGKSPRMEALLWLSKYASAAIDGHANNPLHGDDDPESDDDDVKVHAVFVLSQLRHNEGVPDMLVVARSPRTTPRVRRQTFFWLGQSGDPRAVALFESVLRK